MIGELNAEGQPLLERWSGHLIHSDGTVGGLFAAGSAVQRSASAFSRWGAAVAISSTSISAATRPMRVGLRLLSTGRLTTIHGGLATPGHGLMVISRGHGSTRVRSIGRSSHCRRHSACTTTPL